MNTSSYRCLALLAICIALPSAAAAAQAVPDSVVAITREGQTLLRVNVDGRVGIGTSTPDRRLTVNGTLGATDTIAAGVGIRFPDGTLQTSAAAASTGTSANTPGTLVSRDSTGQFAAGRITLDSLAVSGRSTLGTTTTGRLVASDTVASAVGFRFPDGTVQLSAATSATGTSANTPGTLVQRDGDGDFAAGRVTLDSLAVSGRSALGLTTTGRLIASDTVASAAGFRFPDGSVQLSAAASATGTSANTPGTLVQRDGNGDFAAGRVTLDSLAVSGRSALGTTTTGRLIASDTVASAAGFRFPDGSVQLSAAASATGTSANTPGTLVQRDANGDFAAGTVTLRALSISDNEANGGASIRLRIRSGSNLGDRFLVDSAGGMAAIGSLGIGIILKEGSGERMLWHPYRAAFRAGGVSGDQWNDAKIGFYSAAFGQNVQAEGNWSIASGHSSFTDQPYSVAMGFRAHADGQAAIAMGYMATANAQYAIALGRAVSASGFAGAIVIGDGSTTDSLEATADNQFSLRAAGGIRLFTNSAKTAGVRMQSYPGISSAPWTGCSNVQWVVSASNCAYLSNGGAWTNVSDVNRKHGFAAVRGDDVLIRLRGMPVTTWTYNSEGDEVRHLGPTAQDFHAAFGLGGPDRTHIATVDADGVALAAAKELDSRSRRQQAEIDALRAENAELRLRLDRLEALPNRTPGYDRPRASTGGGS